MPTIEIDFDVFKALTARRPSEQVSENDVLRQLLHLPAKGQDTSPTASPPARGDWVTKGVRFPAGTEFRANFKGQTYLAKVEDGALVWNGKRFDSPSAPAVKIAGHAQNGWNFWECRMPGQTRWIPIKTLRDLRQ
jgi:hypothetical protein